MAEPEKLVGVGLHTAAEAACLLGLPSARVRRWLGGYQGKERPYEPLWALSLPKQGGQRRTIARRREGFIDHNIWRRVARALAAMAGSEERRLLELRSYSLSQ